MDGDEEEVVQRAAKEKNEREQQLSDIAEMLAIPAGRRFFYRLFEEGKLFHTTFTGNSQGMFYEGRRNLALVFFTDLCEVDATALAALLLMKAEKIKGEENG
jgi:hypothetical protein